MSFDWSEIWRDSGRMEGLLLGWVKFLLVLIVAGSLWYYVWRKRTGRGFEFLRMSRCQIDRMVVMSMVTPILAAFFQSAWVVSQGIRFYTAMFWELLSPRLWLLFAIEALITFFALWLFMKIALWLRWPVVMLFVTLWTYIGFQTIAVARGYA